MNNSQFHVPLTSRQVWRWRHRNIGRCLGGALFGVVIAIVLFFALAGCTATPDEDFTDSGVGCIDDCTTPHEDFLNTTTREEL